MSDQYPPHVDLSRAHHIPNGDRSVLKSTTELRVTINGESLTFQQFCLETSQTKPDRFVQTTLGLTDFCFHQQSFGLILEFKNKIRKGIPVQKF